MPGHTFRLYIPPWVFLFIVFGAISGYLFALSANLDVDDPTDSNSNTWVKVNYGVAALMALLAIISIPLGLRHQKKLRDEGWVGGQSAQARAADLMKQTAKYNQSVASNAYAPRLNTGMQIGNLNSS